MADKAEQARNTAAAALKERTKELERYKVKDNVSMKLLQQKYDHVVNAKEDLMMTHFTYAEKAKKDPSSDELSDWLSDKTDEVVDLLDEVFVMLEEAETQSNAAEVQSQKDALNVIEEAKKQSDLSIATTQSESDKNLLAEQIESMKEILDDASRNSVSDATTVQAMLKEIEVTRENLTKSWNTIKSLCGDQQLKLIVATEKDIKKLISDSRSHANAFIDQVKPPPSSSHLPSNSENGSSNSWKTEKIGLPKFSGSSRGYARFKGDFEKIVSKNYSDVLYRTYVLKNNCLVGEAKTLVENLEDLDEIWNRLDSKYGNDREIINMVLNDVKKLDLSKGDWDASLIKLVNVLEKGTQDLAAINSREEIANNYTVTLIQEKLPERILRKWIDLDVSSSSASSKNSFEELLEFLKTERKKAERVLQVKETNKEKNKENNKKRDKKDDDKPQANGYSNYAGGGGNGCKKCCLVHPNADHHTRLCKQFRKKSPEERGALVKAANGCKFCLGKSHGGNPCPFEDKWDKCGLNGCQVYHSRLLHDCGIPEFCNYVDVSSATIRYNNIEKGKTLLLMESVRTPTDELTVFWDDGSTIGLVSKAYVLRAKLKGIEMQYSLETTGGKVETHTATLYEIVLLDRKGDKHVIKAFEIDEICSYINSFDMSEIAKLFPSVSLDQVTRCGGKAELMIGSNYLPLHPRALDDCEGLVLYESKFGTGRIIGGTRQSIQESNEVSAEVRQFANAVMYNPRVTRSKAGIDCFTADDLGIKIPPRCGRCKSCKECRFETYELSRVEQHELSVIRENLKLDPINQRITTQYPYKTDPAILKDNREQAIGLMKSLEKRLRKRNYGEKFNEQIAEFISRNVLVEITKKEMEEYEGPVCYVSTNFVEKPDSKSTPIRLTINSSLQYDGISPNDVWMKGPSSLQNMYGIQLRSRTHKILLVCDLHKFYHTIFTTELEKNIRRIVWRDMKTDSEPKTYGFSRPTFGDKPAGAVCAAAVALTAETYSYIDEDAAQKIKEDSFVDDIVTGDDKRQRVEELKESFTEILSKTGFRIKSFITTGDKSEEDVSLLGSGEEHVLGISWNPETDKLNIRVQVNLSKKQRGRRPEPDLTYDQIPKILEIKLTRRILLGIVNSCYDVFGLVAPILIQLKIELRNLFSKDLKLSWDDEIPEHMKTKWVKMLQLLKSAERIKFQRCIKPEGAVGEPDLIMSNDGSKDAMCCTAHVRWRLEAGGHECVLFASKARVTPLNRQTTPRSEMQSAVMSVRLSKTIQQFSGLNFGTVFYILDSLCSLATLHKDTMALKEYMSHRVTEIIENSQLENWHHVKSKDNISDLGTRSNAVLHDIAEDSEWQRGAAWMSLEVNEWPTSQDFSGAKVPEEDLIKLHRVNHVSGAYPDINFESYKHKSYSSLLRIFATVIKCIRNKHFRINELTSEDIDDAELFVRRESSKLTQKEVSKGKLSSLRPQVDENGIIVLSSRANKGLKHHYGNDTYQILTYNDPLSYIWMKTTHEEDHSGVSRTVAKSRRKYWVVRGRKLANKIKRSCYECRILDKKLAMQQMAPLPDSRLSMSPPFDVTSLDLFGPMEIRDTVKQRVSKKVWGVIFNCASTRAMYLDLTEDYSTDAILVTLRRFVSIRGCPTEMISDQGSQLISAAKDIAELVEDWNWQPIATWAATNRMKWTVVPAEGQHQNGLSESLIKSVKRTIEHKVKPHSKISFSQLQMMLFEIANLLNSRPISVITGSDPDEPEPLTPNHLLLGRATGEVPQGPFDGSKSTTKRYQFIQQLITEWWDKWYSNVLPNLVPCYKWLQRHRSVQIGDVCLIKYGKEKRGKYRLGRVTDVKKGEDELVRKVVLQYKNEGEKVFRSVSRPIQGIAVIVPVEEQGKAEVVNNPQQVTEDNEEQENPHNVHSHDITSEQTHVSCIPTQTRTLNPEAVDFIPSNTTH